MLGLEYRRSAPGAADGFTLDYLGRYPGALTKEQRAGDLPPLLHPVLPGWWDRRGLAAVPALGWRRPDAALPPPLSFRPANPLAPERFTVV